MKPRAKVPLRGLALAGLLLAGMPAAPARTWTNSVGRTFEAEFVRVHGSDVIFTAANGRTFSTPLSELSPADQQRVRTGATHDGAARPGPSRSPQRSAIPATTPTLGHSWPAQVKLPGPVPCKVVSEDAKAGLFIYESPGYRFTCDARVTDDALRNFSVMFESTHQYAAALPLSMKRKGRTGKLDIRLFGETENYIRSGGPPGSAGLFNPSSESVLVPMSSLGLVKGRTGFSLDPKRQNQVLIHELAHQLTPDVYFATGGRGWFSEGLAEYMASTRYSWGYFNPDPYGNVVKSYVTAYGGGGAGGRNLGNTLHLPPLKDFMLMEYPRFAGENGNLNYGASLLLIHYFFHIEDAGRATRITRFLKGLHAGNHGEAALAPLLGGGDFQKLEAEISAAWSKMGVQIHFRRP